VSRIITALDVDEAVRMRAEMRRKIASVGERLSVPAKPRKATKLSPRKEMVSAAHWSLDGKTVAGGVVLQLPIFVDRSAYNTSFGNPKIAHAKAKQQRENVLLALQKHLPWYTRRAEMRAEINRVTFVRLSPRDADADNLQSAFKHIADAVFAWIAVGDKQFDRRAIGHFDAKKRAGHITVKYEQARAENPRAYGIQIWLELISI
jgi:hypothetical protein